MKFCLFRANLFLSDKAPFLFPGFSLMCAAFAMVRSLEPSEYILSFDRSVSVLDILLTIVGYKEEIVSQFHFGCCIKLFSLLL